LIEKIYSFNSWQRVSLPNDSKRGTLLVLRYMFKLPYPAKTGC
jgi:hypothetical protein